MARYGEQEAREAVAASRSYSEALRLLGLRSAGGNHGTFKRYVDEVWQIPTAHFDAGASIRRTPMRTSRPMAEVLVEHSTYPRARLKQRLYEEGHKLRCCELCGQGETWRGRPMSLILDHINGVPDDNRLENLRIVCPNCAATLDTHCGRKNRQQPLVRSCRRCGREFLAKYSRHHYCSHTCGCRWDRASMRGVSKPELRKVERPSRQKLLAEIEATNYCAVGRKYGVSDNAVRKWVRFYERQAKCEQGDTVRERA
jgi:hypothetical protein